MAEIRGVLVDWAGTVTVPLRDVVLRAVTECGLGEEELRRAFAGMTEYVTGTDGPIHRAERGELTDDELLDWCDTNAPGIRAVFDVEVPASIFGAADRPEVVALLRQLRDRDVTVVLATNNFASGQPTLERRYLEPGLVDGIVNSALVGCRKPEAAFFDRCLASLSLRADEVVLLDDMAANVEAARAHGLHAIAVGDDPTAAIDELWALLGRTA